MEPQKEYKNARCAGVGIYSNDLFFPLTNFFHRNYSLQTYYFSNYCNKCNNPLVFIFLSKITFVNRPRCFFSVLTNHSGDKMLSASFSNRYFTRKTIQCDIFCGFSKAPRNAMKMLTRLHFGKSKQRKLAAA